MKKILLIPVLFFAFLINVSAQNNAISIGLDGLAFANEDEEVGSYSGITLGYETALSKRFTAHIHGTMRRDNWKGTNILNLGSKFKNIEGGVNFYPGRANRGLYLGVAAAYTNLNFNLDGENPPSLVNKPTRFYGGGANLGLKISLGKHVSIGGQAGMKYLRTIEKRNELIQFTAGAKLSFNF